MMMELWSLLPIRVKAAFCVVSTLTLGYCLSPMSLAFGVVFDQDQQEICRQDWSRDIFRAAGAGRSAEMEEVDRARYRCSSQVDPSLKGEAKAILSGRSMFSPKIDQSK
ncbi:hypothetical protein [Variovorax sp. tm]|uniref:hypothetical protein n=1 Tax=Variovorax atrisoli TaxID=3394203 RepID=UPI003A804B65